MIFQVETGDLLRERDGVTEAGSHEFVAGGETVRDSDDKGQRSRHEGAGDGQRNGEPLLSVAAWFAPLSHSLTLCLSLTLGLRGQLLVQLFPFFCVVSYPQPKE